MVHFLTGDNHNSSFSGKDAYEEPDPNCTDLGSPDLAMPSLNSIEWGVQFREKWTSNLAHSASADRSRLDNLAPANWASLRDGALGGFSQRHSVFESLSPFDALQDLEDSFLEGGNSLDKRSAQVREALITLAEGWLTRSDSSPDMVCCAAQFFLHSSGMDEDLVGRGKQALTSYIERCSEQLCTPRAVGSDPFAFTAVAYCAAVCESLIRSNGAQVGDRPIPVDVGFEAVLGLKAVLRDVGQGDESQSESSELRVSHAITAIGMLGRFCGERGIAAFSQFAAEIDPRVMSYSGVQLLKSVLQVFSHNSDLAPLRYALDSFPPRYIADRYQPPRRKKLSEMFAYLDRCLSQGEAASNLSSQGIYDLVRRMGGVALSRLVADLDQNKQTSNEASVDCLLMAIACTHTRAGLNQLNLAKYQYPIQARSAIAAMASSVSDSKLADVARNAFWAGAVASSIELGCVPTRHLRALLPDDPRQVSADRVAHVVSGLLRRSRVAEDLNLVTVAGDIVEVARGRASALLAKLWGDNSYVMDMQIEGGLQFWRGPDFEVLAQEPERVAGLLGVTRDPEISSGELTKRVNFLLSASRDWNNREQALCVLRAAELANLPYALVAKLKLSTAVSAMSKRGESNRRGRFLSGVASFVGRFSTMLSGAFQGLIVSRDDL